MAKRKYKPKTLLLSDASDRSVMRLAMALAYTTSGEMPEQFRLEARAKWILRTLQRMS